MRRRGHVFLFRVDRLPDIGAGAGCGDVPVIAEQQIEIAVIPLDRIRGPRALKARGGGVVPLARAMGVDPAQSHFLHRSTFRFAADSILGTGTMAFAKGVAARDQRHGVFIVHAHTRECFPHIAARGQNVRFAIRALRVHIDQTHLNSRQRVLEIAFTGITLVTKPFGFRTPIHVFFRCPNISASTAKSEGLAAHRFNRDVARQDHQIRPADRVAVFLLDRPQQTPCLVEIAIVRPAVQRRETLLASAAATATVCGTIGSGAVPCHADEQATVMAIIRRPPILAVGHQRGQVFLQRLHIQTFERFRIVKILAHRVGLFVMLMQNAQVQLVRPPVAVRVHTLAGVHYRAAALRCVGSVHIQSPV